MSSHALSQRLAVLSQNYRQISASINDLAKFPNGTSFLSNDADGRRLELANEIHSALKDAEDDLDFLRQEVEVDGDSAQLRQSHRNSTSSSTLSEEHISSTIVRLTEDSKNARASFRKAQLQSKRNMEAAKRKEREQLFADRRIANTGTAGMEEGAGSGGVSELARRKGQEKLTQDQLALNASEDVTRALRRTHALMSSNLQQSQFAQQTLEESQQQLRDVSQQYASTTDLLKNSRGLVKQLLVTQKSDTWYLTTSMYILVITIAWLFFRRLLYGPMWWLIWLPLKWSYWGVSSTIGLAAGARAGADGNAISSAAGFWTGNTATVGVPPEHRPKVRTTGKYMPIPPKGGGWGGPAQPPEPSLPESPEMVEQVGKMIEESMSAQDEVVGGTPLTGQAVNTKKRMWEEPVRDEL